MPDWAELQVIPPKGSAPADAPAPPPAPAKPGADWQLMEVWLNGQHVDSFAPLVQIGPNSFVMELFHGTTLAFKDVALQLLGRHLHARA